MKLPSPKEVDRIRHMLRINNGIEILTRIKNALCKGATLIYLEGVSTESKVWADVVNELKRNGWDSKVEFNLVEGKVKVVLNPLKGA